MMGMLEGNQRRGRSCREWLDDIGDWCKEKIHTPSTVSRMTLDRDEWKKRVKCALDTYGLLAHGS